MTEPASSPDGILTSLRRLVAFGNGMFRSRTELFAIELEEERRAVLEVIILTGCAMIFGTLGLALASAAVILVSSPEYRPYVAAALAVVYGAGVFVVWRRINKLLRRRPFDESLNQMKKDWECFTSPE